MMEPVVLGGAVGRATAGELADLYRSEYGHLVRLATLLLGERGAGEEVVQDAFVRLHLGWRRLREPDKAPAWLRSAVLNGARSRLRHRKVQRRHLTVVPGPAPSAEAGALAGDDHRRVVAALAGLPVRQREALVLRYYLELSEAEMAAAMGVAAGTVKTHLHRGLAALAVALGVEEER